MSDPINFPPTPIIGQTYTAPSGVTYQWDGIAWVIGFFTDGGDNTFTVIGSMINQIRILLQDTDISAGAFRYTTSSIVTAINQGMYDMYRLRPDIFLETGFIVPQFNATDLTSLLEIEPQYVSPLIYYTVGLVQARDDEQTQDARAGSFITAFKDAVLKVG